MGIINRLLGNKILKKDQQSSPDSRPIIYSWIQNGKFAIGPMPRSEAHWRQLENAGFRSRFSCCYKEEEVFTAPPPTWRQESVGLPDHRQQEPMNINRLEKALISAQHLIENQPATYIHCFAGRERSALVAVGIIARSEHVVVLQALLFIRLCHPSDSPLFNDLSILDELIKNNP
jgi:hypothetical protein